MIEHPQIAEGLVVLGDDFSQHRIQGFVPHAEARGMNPHLDVPLISHVEGAFYQGGCMDGIRLPDAFDFVLSLYPWEQYDLGQTTRRVEVKMYDAFEQSFDQVDGMAQTVVDHLADGETVLVHCQAGLNRSGLLAARVLTLRGHSGEEAIEILREKRSPLVLCNEAFEDYIRGIA